MCTPGTCSCICARCGSKQSTARLRLQGVGTFSCRHTQNHQTGRLVCLSLVLSQACACLSHSFSPLSLLPLVHALSVAWAYARFATCSAPAVQARADHFQEFQRPCFSSRLCDSMHASALLRVCLHELCVGKRAQGASWHKGFTAVTQPHMQHHLSFAAGSGRHFANSA